MSASRCGGRVLPCRRFYLSRPCESSGGIASPLTARTPSSRAEFAGTSRNGPLFTIWGLFFYPRRAAWPETTNRFYVAARWGRPRRLNRLFALAALAKETAILTPLALCGWEILALCWRAWKRRAAAFSFGEHRAEIFKAFSLLLSLLPLALWLTYHYHRTGYVFGNPEFFRYNVEATLTPARVLSAGAERLWHVTGHMNLFLLTGGAALAMMLLRRPLRDAGRARPRIDVGTQLVFGVLILAHVAALSFVGGAVLARYMLPVLPLLIIVCVSTLWRRARNWRAVVAVVGAGFVLALLVNPPRRYPWEENLAYRDFILLHREAARFIADTHPDARVLTTWPATDACASLTSVTPIALCPSCRLNISRRSTRRARDALQFDWRLIFFHQLLPRPAGRKAATALGGRVIFAKNVGQWVAVITK